MPEPSSARKASGISGAFRGAWQRRWERQDFTELLARNWLWVGVAAVLFIYTNGAVFYLAKHVLNRGGHWEDPAVWLMFVVAGVLVIVLWTVGIFTEHLLGQSNAPLDQSGVDRLALSRWVRDRLALWAIATYSLVSLISTFWSIDSTATLWRSLVYLGLPIAAVLIANLELHQINKAVGMVGLTAVALSLAAVEWRKWTAIDHNYDWKGIFTNRNSLAPVAALGVLACLGWVVKELRVLRARRALSDANGLASRADGLAYGFETSASILRIVGAATGLVASAVTMIYAGSRTAAVGLLLAVGVATLGRLWYRTDTKRWLIWLGALGVSVFGVFLYRTWNEPTLAQRREMWDLLWEYIIDRPLHGWGYFAFWDVPELTYTHVLLGRGSAHNSFVETAVGLGLLGLVPMVVIVGLAVRNLTLQLRADQGVLSWWWAATIMFLLVENLTESFVLWFSYNWVLIMVAALRKPVPIE